ADLRKKTIESLTPTTERVDRFDIRDRKHYVYLGSDRTEGRKVQDEDQPSAVVGTGRSIYELIFPADPISMQISSSSRNDLWAGDGQEILQPGTFLSSRDNAPSRPCIAVLEILSNTRTCVEVLKVRTDTAVEDGYHTILGAQFVSGDSQRLLVNFINRVDESLDATEYKRTVDGSWQVSGQIKGIGKAEHNGLRVTVKQGLNDPPQLVATNKEASRVIWDPNPQLKNLEWGEASAYK